MNCIHRICELSQAIKQCWVKQVKIMKKSWVKQAKIVKKSPHTRI